MSGIPVNKKRLHLDFDPDYQDGHETVDKRRCIDEESVPGIEEPWLRRLDVALENKQREVLHVQEMSHRCRRALHFVRVGAANLCFDATLQQRRAGLLWPTETLRGTGVHPAISQLLNTSMKNIPTPSFLIRKTRRKVTTLASEDTIIGSGRSLYGETQAEDVKRTSDEGELVVMKDGMTDSTRYEASGSIKDETSYPAKHETSDSIKGETLDSLKDNALDSAKSKALDTTKDEALTKIPRYVPPFIPDPPTVCAASVRMERHRIKRRIVVGNISKWLPEEFRQDAASHKWMMYVRGPRDAPNVSDIISKVRYFLHPSYQPNDIVDVVHPFYLNRRGWGEFPVRVQVHFSLPGNRPIDIIHNLKLDRTYSGLQTLGSETVVDVWLKTPLPRDINHLLEDEKNKEVNNVPSPILGNIMFNDGEHLTLAHKASDEEVLGSETVVDVRLKTPLPRDINHLSEDEKSKEVNSIASPTQGNIMFNDGEHLTLVHKASDEEVLGIETVVNVRLKTPLPRDINHLSEDEKNKEVNSIASPTPGNILFNDGDHLTLDHIASDEGVPCVVPKQDIIEEVTERVQDGKKPSYFTKEVVFHSIPDHDYLGVGSFKTGCTTSASDLNRENVRGFFALEDYVFYGAHEGIKYNGASERMVCPDVSIESEDSIPTVNSEEYCKQKNSKDLIFDSLRKKNGVSKTYVQCVDDKGNVLLISLEKPDLSTNNVHRIDTVASTSEKSSELSSNSAGCSLYGDIFEDSRGFLKVLTSDSFVGRSVLKKNVFSSLVKEIPNCVLAPKEVGLPIDASELVLCGSPTTSCQMYLPSEQCLRKAAGTLLSRLEARTAATWALRLLPLAPASADSDSTFGHRYAFCAPSPSAFNTWPLGRRLIVQRLRAKTVLDVLREEVAEPFAHWSVRHLQQWARSHGLEPALPSRQRPPPPSARPVLRASDALRCTLTEPTETRDWLERTAEASRAAQELEEVDVECHSEPSHAVDFKNSAAQEENDIVLPIGSEFLDDDAEYLRSIIRRVGFKLSVEPLCPGYLYPSAECLMLSACKFLCEDILRRSLHQASNHCKGVASEICVADVKDALLTRREFDIFTNVGLGVLSYTDL